jgi:hypothetical protein
MTPRTYLRVSFVTDATDTAWNAVRRQADALMRPDPEGRWWAQVRVFAPAALERDSRVVVAEAPARLLADEFLLTSDVVLFHYTARYDLFDAIHLTPRSARLLAYYHGIRRPTRTDRVARWAMEESYRQAAALRLADRVMVPSQSLRDELEALGVEPDRVIRVPLASDHNERFRAALWRGFRPTPAADRVSFAAACRRALGVAEGENRDSPSAPELVAAKYRGLAPAVLRAERAPLTERV